MQPVLSQAASVKMKVQFADSDTFLFKLLEIKLSVLAQTEVQLINIYPEVREGG